MASQKRRRDEIYHSNHTDSDPQNEPAFKKRKNIHSKKERISIQNSSISPDNGRLDPPDPARNLEPHSPESHTWKCTICTFDNTIIKQATPQQCTMCEQLQENGQQHSDIDAAFNPQQDDVNNSKPNTELTEGTYAIINNLIDNGHLDQPGAATNNRIDNGHLDQSGTDNSQQNTKLTEGTYASINNTYNHNQSNTHKKRNKPRKMKKLAQNILDRGHRRHEYHDQSHDGQRGDHMHYPRHEFVCQNRQGQRTRTMEKHANNAWQRSFDLEFKFLILNAGIYAQLIQRPVTNQNQLKKRRKKATKLREILSLDLQQQALDVTARKFLIQLISSDNITNIKEVTPEIIKFAQITINANKTWDEVIPRLRAIQMAIRGLEHDAQSLADHPMDLRRKMIYETDELIKQLREMFKINDEKSSK
eukprot:864732_1